jgi:hypothetical protein
MASIAGRPYNFVCSRRCRHETDGKGHSTKQARSRARQHKGKTMNRITRIAANALCVLGALVAADARAQVADTWKWQGSIYGYLPDISGTTTFPASTGGGGTVDASKILDSLKFTFMGTLEASNGRWGVYTDLVYLDLGNTKTGYRDFTIGGAAIPVGTDTNVSFDLKGLAWTLAGTWRVAESPASRADLFAGARLFDMKQTLGYEVTGNVASIPVGVRAGSSEADIANWDAIIGAKGRFALGESGKWFAPWYVDIGTGESDLTFQAMGGLGYSFKWGDVVAVWRYLDYDMKSGKKIESMTFNGPAIAATFHW